MADHAKSPRPNPTNRGGAGAGAAPLAGSGFRSGESDSLRESDIASDDNTRRVLDDRDDTFTATTAIGRPPGHDGETRRPAVGLVDGEQISGHQLPSSLGVPGTTPGTYSVLHACQPADPQGEPPMTDHVICETAPCDTFRTSLARRPVLALPHRPSVMGEGWVEVAACQWPTRTTDSPVCRNCLGDGRRVVLDSAIPVEPTTPEHVTKWVDNPKRVTRTNVGPTLARWRALPADPQEATE